MAKAICRFFIIGVLLLAVAGCVYDPYTGYYYPGYYGYYGYYSTYPPGPPGPYYGPPGERWVPGHWNTAGDWVPGHWTHWVPGHYNPSGEWIPGHWK